MSFWHSFHYQHIAQFVLKMYCTSTVLLTKIYKNKIFEIKSTWSAILKYLVFKLFININDTDTIDRDRRTPPVRVEDSAPDAHATTSIHNIVVDEVTTYAPSGG